MIHIGHSGKTLEVNMEICKTIDITINLCKLISEISKCIYLF